MKHFVNLMRENVLTWFLSKGLTVFLKKWKTVILSSKDSCFLILSGNIKKASSPEGLCVCRYSSKGYSSSLFISCLYMLHGVVLVNHYFFRNGEVKLKFLLFLCCTSKLNSLLMCCFKAIKTSSIMTSLVLLAGFSWLKI